MRRVLACLLACLFTPCWVVLTTFGFENALKSGNPDDDTMSMAGCVFLLLLLQCVPTPACRPTQTSPLAGPPPAAPEQWVPSAPPSAARASTAVSAPPASSLACGVQTQPACACQMGLPQAPARPLSHPARLQSRQAPARRQTPHQVRLMIWPLQGVTKQVPGLGCRMGGRPVAVCCLELLAWHVQSTVFHCQQATFCCELSIWCFLMLSPLVCLSDVWALCVCCSLHWLQPDHNCGGSAVVLFECGRHPGQQRLP